jgi:hypothetical protein
MSVTCVQCTWMQHATGTHWKALNDLSMLEDTRASIATDALSVATMCCGSQPECAGASKRPLGQQEHVYVRGFLPRHADGGPHPAFDPDQVPIPPTTSALRARRPSGSTPNPSPDYCRHMLVSPPADPPGTRQVPAGGNRSAVVEPPRVGLEVSPPRPCSPA